MGKFKKTKGKSSSKRKGKKTSKGVEKTASKGKDKTTWTTNKKIVFWSIVVIAIIIFSLGATKIYLYVNLLLGNDIIIKLTTSQEDFSLIRGQSQSVDFEASVITNPFCKATCHSVFKDISKNKVIETKEFNISQSDPQEFSYNLLVERFGTGQKLYRFSMACQSIPTTLCHTEGKPTSRSVLLTVEYNLSENESLAKNNSMSAIKGFEENFLNLTSNLESYESLASNNSFIQADFSNVKKQIRIANDSIKNFKNLWTGQDYLSLWNDVKDYSLSDLDNSFNELKQSIDYQVISFNQQRDRLDRASFFLSPLLNYSYPIFLYQKISSLNNQFNEAVLNLPMKTNLNLKAENLSIFIKSAKTNFTINKTLDSAIAYQILCIRDGICANITLIFNTSIESACNYWNDFVIFNDSIVRSNTSNYSKSDNSSSGNFSSKKISYLDEAKNLLLSQTSGVIRSILESKTNIGGECLLKKPSPKLTSLPQIIVKPTAKLAPVNSDTLMTLPMCCVFSNCSPCSNNPDENYPIVFVHGHAFNKGVDAEYSLDSFNPLQERLEKDGYINAGAISLYTPKNIPYGVWGLFNKTVTIKASYYIDSYEEQNNYVLVNTKSENIDTYAIRLKELIDTVKFKTGKSKIKIVAHSMGGLVSRRYIQIFGSDDVDELIMFGTPNHGIIGQVADLCGFVGGDLECRDMTNGSLFLNKLNRDSLPNIPIAMIIGSGCDMQGLDGDGIVTVDNARLKNADEFIVNGSCDSINKLHSKILNPNKFPDMYKFFISELER